MNQSQLANPFASATVVVADQFVDTFPHPQGLITYLHRLCLQLDVDIVSLDRPVTVKGSWKTIVKIEAFLKTLMSSLHSAVSEGVVPSEEDFDTALSQFQVEDSSRSESKEDKRVSQDILLSNELDEFKTDSYLDIIKTDEDRCDAGINITDKWYFHSNPRGKTTDKRKRYPGRQPPEPYIIVEADGTSKSYKANLVEIEHVLSQVYRKETIEKYQQLTSSGCDKNTQPVVSDELGSAKEEVVDSDEGQHKSEEQCVSTRRQHALMENTSSNSLPHVKNSISSKELKRLEISENCVEKEVVNCNETSKKIDDEFPRPVRLRLSLRQNRTTAEISHDVAVLKRPKKRKTCGRRRRKCKANGEVRKEATNCKITKHDKASEILSVESRRVSRRIKEANSENMLHAVGEKNETICEGDHDKINTKTTNKQCKLGDVVENETGNNCIPAYESNVETKTSHHICNEEKSVIQVKKNNLKKEAQDVKYSCNECSYTTVKHVQLLDHKRRVHLTKSFQCEECLKEFGFLKDLRRHMKCHTKAENCCDICGKMYKEVRKLEEHKRIHADGYMKPEFPCKFCMKIFSTKYVLAYHIKADHLGMKRSYICPTCGKSFSQKNSYLQHANVHLGIRPFTCEICGKKFSYEKSLKEHKFTHNNEKIFSCSFCNKSFRQASGLAIHLKVHKTTKDYVCSMCGKGFNQKQALVRHERIHAGDKPYECALCKRTFADSSVLRRHMILIHKKDPKLWREDTKCYVPRRTDFFISVLNGDRSSDDNSEFKLNGDRSSADNSQFKLNGVGSSADNSQFKLNGVGSSADNSQFKLNGVGSSADNSQFKLNGVGSSADNSQFKLNGVDSSADNSQFNSIKMHGSTACNEHQKQQRTEFCQQEIHHEQFRFVQGKHAEESVENMRLRPSISNHYNSIVNKTLPRLDQRDAVVKEASDCTDSSCSDMKPFSSEKIVAPDEMIGSTETADHRVVGHVGFSTAASQINSPESLHMHGSIPTSEHRSRPEACQHHVSFSAHLQPQHNPGPAITSSSYVPHPGQVASSSFVSGSYQQHQQTNYDSSTVEMQPVPYSSVMLQPCAQTIVLLQDSLEAFSYHQQVLRVAYPGDSTIQGANLQHISPSLSISSTPLPQVAGMRQAISSLSSGQMYEQVISSGHQLPQ